MQRALRTAVKTVLNMAEPTTLTTDSPYAHLHHGEEHVHGENIPFGNDGAGNIEAHSLDPFILTAGAGDAFGTEMQIHDGSVLNAIVGLYCDIGRVFVETANQAGSSYIIEFWSGTGAFGAATRMTGMIYRSAAANVRAVGTIFPCRRVLSTDKIWARCKCKTDAKTVNFLLEIHGYAY